MNTTKENKAPMVTPLYIEIAMHYVCRGDEFPRLDAPACKQAVEDLQAHGLLEYGNFQLGDLQRHYAPTEGLRKWVDRLCEVPFPVLTWTFDQPET